MTRNPTAVFWSYVDKTDLCWIWRGGPRGGKGVSFRWHGRSHRARHVSWEITHGLVRPETIDVITTCGNEYCVRPDHLAEVPRGAARGPKVLDAPVRFWRLVHVRSPEECWEWQGARNAKGYGDFHRGEGKHLMAHQFSWLTAHGRFSAFGGVIMHACDNPPCVNPQHLTIGTMSDNQQDMARKGRAARGERSGLARLTNEKVRTIRQRLEAGMVHKAIAEEFGVSREQIGHIARGTAWKHVV